MSDWLFDEYQHCGIDYAQAAQAETYDDRHQRFRDYGKEFVDMLAFLGLEQTQELTLVDLGCGTGTTALLAAGRFKSVYAVDVSEAMLERATAKNRQQATNIHYLQGGFLTYCHAGEPADVVITKAAFHHLPDFWKQVALLRMNRMLKTGGLLYIHDVVFQFDPHQYRGTIDAWIARLGDLAGDEIRAEVETHIRDEHSTFGWILQGMIERAGFVVDKVRCGDDFVAEYACRKVTEVPGEEGG